MLVFTGSVRGLSIGAPVLLRGIQIGKVLDIQLRFDPERLDFEIPVLVEVEPERISLSKEQRERLLEKDPNLLRRLVEQGLRGQLKTGSLLTGQLYVELDFFKDAAPAQLSMREGYRVLPTVPAPLEAVQGRISSILTKIDSFPLEKIGSDLTETLSSIRALVDSKALKGSLAELEQTLEHINAVAGQLDADVVPELDKTLSAARQALTDVSGMIGPDAPINVEMVRTMRDVSAAARSIRNFLDYLDRHPEALLRGKGAR